MIRLNNKYLDSCASSPPNLTNANEYNKFLQESFNASADYSYIDLEESIYPIDTQYIDKISNIVNLENFLLDNIIYGEKDSFFSKMTPYWDLSRIKLFICGENCD